MSADIINTTILAFCFLALFGIAELLYHKFSVRAEFTRKFVHVVTGLLTLLFPFMLGNHWLVLLLCSSFAVILIISLRFNLLKSINAIDRKSVGSIAYPASVYVCYLAFDYHNQNFLLYYLPILVLAICDPIAALTGKKWPVGEYHIGKNQKTLMGSGMFFISAIILSTITIAGLDHNIFIFYVARSALWIGVTSAFVEAVSPRGFDNITIPISVLLVLIIL